MFQKMDLSLILTIALADYRCLFGESSSHTTCEDNNFHGDSVGHSVEDWRLEKKDHGITEHQLAISHYKKASRPYQSDNQLIIR